MSSASDPVSDAVRRCLAALPAGLHLKLAFSGGMDSHVLLHALTRANAAGAGRDLAAVHVNHGLQPAADAWADHCRRVCDDLGVPLETLRVTVPRDAGEGPEAAARRARYAALEQHLDGGDALLLAHHLDDQAETFLLQLLRGAGPAGLSAMPATAALGRATLVRPLLEVTREEIRAYAGRCALDYIEDPSNADLGFDRNYLRHEIMPRLKQRWPAAARTIARAAGYQAVLAGVARDLGAKALEAAEGSVALSCRVLAQLPADIARLALRAWLEGRGFPPPSRALLDRILDEVVTAAADAEPLVTWRGAEVRRYRGMLHVMAPLNVPDPSAVHAFDPDKPLVLPHGVVAAVPATGAGLDARLCRRGALEVRFRRGGERCRPAGRARSSTLKAWFQRCGVPPWERDRVPLLYLDGMLAAVAGLFVCEGFQCPAGEPGLVIEWTPANDRGRGMRV